MIIHNAAITGSLSLNGVDLSSITGSSGGNNFATTGSNTFIGNQTITGSLTTTGTITAQRLVVQTVTSSIVYSSGSNIFGNSSSNTQVMTGSVRITGSLSVTGSLNITGSIFTTGSIRSTGTSSEFRRIYTITEPKSTPESAFTGSGVNDTILTSIIQSDGKVVVGGAFTEINSTSLNRIARLTNSGSIDSSFNIDGIGFNGTVHTIAMQSDGKIIVGGDFTEYNGTTQNYITRLNSDGSIDTGFTIGTGFSALVYNIQILSDGKIVVVGGFTVYNGTTQNYITRLLSNGTRDTSFYIGTGFNNPAYVISLIPSSSFICVGGEFTTYNGATQNGLVILFSNGNRYTTFNIGTGFYNITNGTPALINSIAVHTVPSPIITSPISDLLVTLNGRIVVGGNFEEFNGTPQYGITRLLSNGTRDTNFSTGLGFPYIDANGSPIFDNAGSYVSSIVIQDNGKILVGGRFTQYQNISAKYLMRLNQNGSFDLGFNVSQNLRGSENYLFPPSGYPDSVNSIIIQPDGKLLFSGLFVREIISTPFYLYNIGIGRSLSITTFLSRSLPTIDSNILLNDQTINGTLTINDIVILNLPTSDPGIHGSLYNDYGFLKISSY